jgi:hypothetical protein
MGIGNGEYENGGMGEYENGGMGEELINRLKIADLANAN